MAGRGQGARGRAGARRGSGGAAGRRAGRRLARRGSRAPARARTAFAPPPPAEPPAPQQPVSFNIRRHYTLIFNDRDSPFIKVVTALRIALGPTKFPYL